MVALASTHGPCPWCDCWFVRENAHRHIVSDVELLIYRRCVRSCGFGREMAYGNVFRNVVNLLRPNSNSLERGSGFARIYSLAPAAACSSEARFGGNILALGLSTWLGAFDLTEPSMVDGAR